MLIDPSVLAAQEQARAAWMQVWIAGLQGLLTVAALAIAIGVPVWQERRAATKKSRDRYIEGRELATLILPAVKQWGDVAGVLAAKARNADVVDVFFKHETAFDLPGAIQSQIGRLHLLGEAALPLQDAIRIATQSKNVWWQYDDAAKGNTLGEEADHAIQTGHDTVYRLKALLILSNGALEAFFNRRERADARLATHWDYSRELEAFIRNDKLGERRDWRERPRRRRDPSEGA